MPVSTATWVTNVALRHRPQRDDDDLGREDEVGAHGALDLVLLERHQVDRGVGERMHELGLVRLVLGLAVQDSLCAIFSTPSKQRKAPPIISSGVTAQGARALMASAAGTRMALLMAEPLATAHTTGSSRLGADAGDLLGVERQVVAQHAGGLLRGDLGQKRHVVEDRGDIVEQGEQAGRHPDYPPRWSRSRSMISSIRDGSVARTACGTFAGISTTDCGVVCTSRPPIVRTNAPDNVRTSASNGAVCSASS